MQEGYRFRGVLPGGGSTDFLVEEHLDVPMDFETIQKAGSRMGTGTMSVLDDQTCPVGMVLNLMRSSPRSRAAGARPAGKACPGRAILEAIESGGASRDLDRLRRHATVGARAHLLRPGPGGRGAAQERPQVLQRGFRPTHS